MNSKAVVHSTVGTSFGLTHPDALEVLLCKAGTRGTTYVVPHDCPVLFHPKVYLFHRRSCFQAIIGSANLTEGAFQSNAEAGTLITLSKDEFDSMKSSMLRWRDEHGKELTGQRLAWYRANAWHPLPRNRRNLQSMEDAEELPRASVGKSLITRDEFLFFDWNQYFSELKSNRPDDLDRFTDALRFVSPILLKRPLPVKGSKEFKALMGGKPTDSDRAYWEHDFDPGYFGRISGSGHAMHRFSADRRFRSAVERLVPVIHASRTDDDALRAAGSMWKTLSKCDDIRSAVITRLLVFSAPSRFFAANNKSVRMLSDLTGIPQVHLREWEGYRDALQFFWSSRWFRSKPPARRTDKVYWDARTALLDALVQW